VDWRVRLVRASLCSLHPCSCLPSHLALTSLLHQPATDPLSPLTSHTTSQTAPASEMNASHNSLLPPPSSFNKVSLSPSLPLNTQQLTHIIPDPSSTAISSLTQESIVVIPVCTYLQLYEVKQIACCCGYSTLLHLTATKQNVAASRVGRASWFVPGPS
jgi:hypothetical protein